MEEYSIARQRRDFHEALPTPLSQTRSLAVRLRPDLPRKTTATSHLPSTLLKKLPSEVRILVWEYVIGNQKIHIVSKFGRLGHVVCNAEYWADNRAERPGLRASSYMFTYGSLPMTKQLADWSLCDLLRTCRQIYTEALPILYTTNTFAFWDLRVLDIFKSSIPSARWRTIRSVEIYAMFYRHEDIPAACEARSSLQLEAWPSAASALGLLPDLRHLRIWIANPFYLDQKYLDGDRTGLYAAVRAFLLQCKGVGVRGGLEVVLPVKKRGVARAARWNTYALKGECVVKLEEELRSEGLDCRVCVGDIEAEEEDVEERLRKTRVCR